MNKDPRKWQPSPSGNAAAALLRISYDWDDPTAVQQENRTLGGHTLAPETCTSVWCHEHVQSKALITPVAPLPFASHTREKKSGFQYGAKRSRWGSKSLSSTGLWVPSIFRFPMYLKRNRSRRTNHAHQPPPPTPEPQRHDALSFYWRLMPGKSSVLSTLLFPIGMLSAIDVPRLPAFLVTENQVFRSLIKRRGTLMWGAQELRSKKRCMLLSHERFHPNKQRWHDSKLSHGTLPKNTGILGTLISRKEDLYSSFSLYATLLLCVFVASKHECRASRITQVLKRSSPAMVECFSWCPTISDTALNEI